MAPSVNAMTYLPTSLKPHQWTFLHRVPRATSEPATMAPSVNAMTYLPTSLKPHSEPASRAPERATSSLSQSFNSEPTPMAHSVNAMTYQPLLPYLPVDPSTRSRATSEPATIARQVFGNKLPT